MTVTCPLTPIAVDFEYIPRDDGGLDVVCGVARNLRTGQLVRRWRDEMNACPFYDVGPGSVLIAFNAQAEMEAHQALGWPPPVNVLCLFAEHMLDTNGADVPMAHGNLLAALECNRLPARHATEKRSVIERILAGPPYDADEKCEILDYCQQDVDDAVALFNVLWGRLSAHNPRYLDQALLRGEYAKAMAEMTRVGCPVNVALHDCIVESWQSVRHALIDSVQQFDVYVNGIFRHDRFAELIERRGAADVWPRTTTGLFSVASKDFRAMTAIYPELEPLRSVHEAVASTARIPPLPICSDGRVRLGRREFGNRRLGFATDREDTASVGFGAYRARTGRNQPKAVEFLPAASSWWRTIVTPPDGKAIGYFDYKSQEYGIAAYLSGDAAMTADYEQGEVYLPLGIRAGLIPPTATKATHGEYRDKVLKPVLLGLQYGRQPRGIALAIGGGDTAAYRRNLATAERIYHAHKQTHRTFWVWVDAVAQEAYLTGGIETLMGWRMAVGAPATKTLEAGRWLEYGTKPLTLLNWKMQSNGADIMRLACAALIAAGIDVIYPVHDAILFQTDVTLKDEIGDFVAATMERAARTVIGGRIPVDRQWILPGENWRPPKGDRMWAIVRQVLEGRSELRGVR
jgi:DNA polymerase I